LSKGDAATIKEQTGKILATMPDLKNAEPQKNLKQIAAFRKIASEFAGDVKKTAAMVKADDFPGAKDVFQLAQARCNECHKKFRD
jgi:cytochrome c556